MTSATSLGQGVDEANPQSSVVGLPMESDPVKEKPKTDPLSRFAIAP